MYYLAGNSNGSFSYFKSPSRLSVAIFAAVLPTFWLVSTSVLDFRNLKQFKNQRTGLDRKPWIELILTLNIIVLQVVTIISRLVPDSNHSLANTISGSGQSSDVIALLCFRVIEIIALSYASYLLFALRALSYAPTSLLLFWSSEILVYAFRFGRLVTLSEPNGIDYWSLPFVYRFGSLLISLFMLALVLRWYPARTHQAPNTNYEAVPQEEVEAEAKSFIEVACPSEIANLYSTLIFSWISPLLVLGSKKTLSIRDLWKPPSHLTCGHTTSLLEREWLRLQRDQKSMTVVSALVRAFWPKWLFANSLTFVTITGTWIQPQLLRALLKFVESRNDNGNEEGPSNGYLLASGLFAATALSCLSHQMCIDQTFQLQNQVKTSVSALIHQKALRLALHERMTRSQGQISNLMTVDLPSIEFLTELHILPSMILEIGIAFVSLWYLIGWSMFPALAVMVMLTWLTSRFLVFQQNARERLIAQKDARSTLLTEILHNMRTIRWNAWEECFEARLLDIRNNRELKELKSYVWFHSLSGTLGAITPFLVAFTSFAFYSYFGKQPLTADIVFPCLTIYALIKRPGYVVPYLIGVLANSQVSNRRVTDFLLAEEVEPKSESETREVSPSINCDKATFAWSRGESAIAIQDIDLNVRSPAFISVVGKVGCGKSALLQGLLGELVAISGSASIKGSMAYASQQPWLISDSIRNNITFGRSFDPAWYSKVITACALTSDLHSFTAGDETQVGEGAQMTSGGQRARIALARAVYSQADIYFLDDPLSAVDSHVSHHIYHHVIRGLLKEKVVVLCTHLLQYTKEADEILLLSSGSIIERGRFTDVAGAEGSKLARLLKEETKISRSEEGKKSTETAPCEELKKEQNLDASRVKETKNEEQILSGRVKWSVFKRYFRWCGYTMCVVFLVVCILQQVLAVASNLWLQAWAQSNSDHGWNDRRLWWLSIYLLLGLSATIVEGAQTPIAALGCALRAARHAHDRMTRSVLRAPMRFFDTTPVGTIQNRFIKDMSSIDERLYSLFESVIWLGVATIAPIGVIIFSLPMFIALLIPLGYCYNRICQYYLRTSRSLVRLASSTISPVLEAVNEGLSGASTIRAFSMQDRCVTQMAAANDRQVSASYLSRRLQGWLSVRIELLASAVVFFVSTLAIHSVVQNSSLSTGQVGLIVSYSLTMSEWLNQLILAMSRLETELICVERVQEFIDLEPEAARTLPESSAPVDWPTQGSFEFRSVSARYKVDAQLVLDDVSFSVAMGERIGVCGRTGSGKSSLLSALYRLIEIEEGSIMLDGVDVSTLGLQDLRSSISIVPQDSGIFGSSVRQNLDPLGSTSDHRLWEILDEVGLRDYLTKSSEGLETILNEGGASLSQGQRQQLCVARALLRKTKILFVDEATSQIDSESDRVIQKIFKDGLKGTTLFVIAHRIETILESDKILVMDSGRVAEFDTPSNLLSNPNSLFSALVRSSTQGSSLQNSGAATPAPRAQ